MRRFLAIILFALLPFQFTWAAVAPYCGHETQAAVEHFGHHDHQHPADTGDGIVLGENSEAGTDATTDAGDVKTRGMIDLDCGHCHGTCSMILSLPSAPPGALSTLPPIAVLKECGGAHAPTRPERPQWLPLA
ncbi:hypothetical protein [Aquincola sp. J276]|uniref:hypothetical protein n=1 Tax=Aquincola sp. J276 TaxID=2898432 RepID=UPI002151F2E9|nr:hypothetical protein [Aquincola sp. J276]MCR5867599.1 hypothetical protein [Aquincola sp. J276]